MINLIKRIFSKKNNFEIKKRRIKRYLPKSPVIVDCGSHNGNDSIEWLKLLPNSIIFALEPNPFVFKQLVQNTSNLHSIDKQEIALADRDDILDFYISEGSSDASSSLSKPKLHLEFHPEVLFKKKIKVKAYKLSTWCELNRVKRIDLLWLDMQGYEFQMLRESQHCLKFIRSIHTEVSMIETYEDVCFYQDFKDWLEQNGFKEIYKAIPKGADMGNVFFVNTKFNID